MPKIESSGEETQAGDESNSNDELLKVARERFDAAEKGMRESHKLALEDKKFLAGDQWPEQIKADRDRKGRPTLVINRLPLHVRQVTNDARQNRPSIKVYPVDDKADVETAKVLQGMVKHIETNSNADVAYDTAYDGAVKGGFGYFRITTDYSSPTSFDQEILIKRIRNPLSVFLDPFSSEPDGSDANYAFIVEDISHDEYKAQYPKSEVGSKSSDWGRLANDNPTWITDKTCRIAEYFYKELKEVEIVLLSDGTVVEAKELTEEVLARAAIEGITEKTRRTAKVPKICWVKMNAVEVLEETEWPGAYIPIVPVYGDEQDLNGVRVLEGIVRHAKDPQRMYNYWASSETEMIALAPKAPYMVAEGQIEGYEAQWANANRENYAYLTYKPTTIDGQPVPPPQRNAFEAPVAAISQARMMSSEDLKATTGIYDASLGNRSNENSGIAIQRRNMQAQTANFHFVDNLTRSIRHAGRILVDLIPKVYDTARVARIIGEEGDQKIVTINGQPPEGSNQQQAYMLDAGKYDVVCDVGPSYATKRQEAVQSMLDMTKAYPKVAEVAGDLLVKNMDWPGAKEVSERLKKTLPPGLADDDDAKKPIPPQVQAQLQQQAQLIEHLTQAHNESTEIIKTKRMELESKERIEMAKLETQATIEMAKLQSTEALELLAHQVAELDARFAQLGGHIPFENENQDFSGQMPDQQMPAQAQTQQPIGGQSPSQSVE